VAVTIIFFVIVIAVGAFLGYRLWSSYERTRGRRR